MPLSTGSRIVTVIAAGFALAILPRLWSFARMMLGPRREESARRAARAPDMNTAPAFHDALAAEASAEGNGDVLDERTWRDLDFDDVFCRLDFTASEPGRQYLYRMLRTPGRDPATLARFDRAVRSLAASDQLERVRTSLRKLQDPRASRLVSLSFEDLPRRPAGWPIFPALTAAAVVCLAMASIWPRAFLWWLGICCANIVVQVAYKFRVKRFAPALHEIPTFLRVSAELGRGLVPELEDERRVLADGARELAPLARATRWLRFEPGQSNEIASTLYEYVNLLFLLDVNAYVFSVEALRSARGRLREMFTALGHVDAVQSVAAWRETLDRWCSPDFTEPCKRLHVDGLVHPLLDAAIPNALDLDETSALVSGSNMAGKTTFVRALGVNAVLAQTLSTVCATTYRAPPLRVRSSIGRADSVTEGKSYYLAEVESVLELIRAKDDGTQHLFLLDETFRGTNTTERVAAAYAVLRHLDEGRDIVVVATHDLEVLDLLGGAYAPYHFREQILNDELTFDYRIQPGPSSTRNAIALLRFMQYPERVVEDATAHLDWQMRRGVSGEVGDGLSAAP